MSEAKCYCESCLSLRERRPDLREIPGHIIVASEEGTVSYIPTDVVLTDAPRPPARRNWLKEFLR